MNCPRCRSTHIHKNGTDQKTGKQKFRCSECGKNFYEEYSTGSYSGPVSSPTPKKPGGLRLNGTHKSELKARYDLRGILRGVISMFEEDGMLYKQSVIVKECNFPYGAAYSDLLKDDEFKPYHGKLDGQEWWGHPNDIIDMHIDTPMR